MPLTDTQRARIKGEREAAKAVKAAKVREAKESKTKSRDIMVVFILAGGEVDCSL